MQVYELQSVVLTWRKCPSVMTGGKTFFHVAFCKGDKYTVVWDRYEESWTVTKNDVHVTNVASVAKGKRYVERMIGGYDAIDDTLGAHQGESVLE
jgi:hypothetical protein